MGARVHGRKYVTQKVEAVTRTKPTSWWMENLEKAKVGCAPIMNIDEVFADKHVLARGMKLQMDVPAIGAAADLIGSPMKFSETEGDYRIPPPRLGEHTNSVLEAAGYSSDDIESLRGVGAV